MSIARPAPGRSPIVHAGAEISSPRRQSNSGARASSQHYGGISAAPAGAPAPAYRKQKEWQDLVDELTAENIKVRDDLQQEIRQMRDRLAQLRNSHVDYENNVAMQQASFERHLEGKSLEAQTLQAELYDATAREIQSVQELAFNEANCKAQCRQLEAVISYVQQAATVAAEGASAREQGLEARLETVKAFEVEARQAAAASYSDALESSRLSDERIQQARFREIEVNEEAALSQAATLRECHEIEASVARAQLSLENVESKAKLQEQKCDAKLIEAQSCEEDAQAAVACAEELVTSMRQNLREAKQELEIQRSDAAHAAEVSEQHHRAHCQGLEVEAQGRMQEQQLQLKRLKKEEEQEFLSRYHALESDMDDIRARGLEQLQAVKLEASQEVTALKSEHSARQQEFAAHQEELVEQSQIVAKEFRREHRHEAEQLQEKHIQAENEVAIVEAKLAARVQQAEEKLRSSEKAVAHTEKVCAKEQDAMKAQMQTAVEEAAQAESRALLSEANSSEQRQGMVLHEESLQLRTIDAKHELARVEVAAQAHSQQLKAEIAQVRLEGERQVAAAVACHRDYEVQVEVRHHQEIEALVLSAQNESVVAKRCKTFEAQAQRLLAAEIEAEHTEDTAAATAAAERRRLEATIEQMRRSAARQEAMNNARVEVLEADLVAARAESVSEKQIMERQLERLRPSQRLRRPVRRPDEEAMSRPLEPQVQQSGPASSYRKNDSPDAGGGGSRR